MFYEDLARERVTRLREEGDRERRVRGLVTMRRAERMVHRARAKLTMARLRLARMAGA